MSSKFKPLLVGLPRSGFTLTASVLQNIFNEVENKYSNKQRAYRFFSYRFGNYLSSKIISFFKSNSLEEDLMFNKNFQYMLGGPIWNNDALGKRAYLRKYIGIKNLGDFTLITSHPLELLDQYDIVHSHGPFSSWIDQEPFKNYQKISSVRNPFGIINSAAHSINALASEYIQRELSDKDAEQLRINLAYNKLSDLKFFKALLKPLKAGLIDQLQNKNEFFQVCWESLVTEPQMEISKILKFLKYDLGNSFVEKIWKKIGFRNLTGHHKHNYRVGKAYAGDELESLTTEHVEIMKEEGFEEICYDLGYAPPILSPSNYTDFQKKVSTSIQEGKPLNPTKDPDLFNFAFNKSNISIEGFGFRQHPWREHTRIERSNLIHEDVELEVSEIAERACSILNFCAKRLIEAINGYADIDDLSNALRDFDFEYPHQEEDKKKLLGFVRLHLQYAEV